MTLSTWEHPLNKKRRLNRTAFREATKNALPRNVVNKIFSYKEAANYLRNTYPLAHNQVRNAYTRWLTNSNSKMNTSEKLKFIDKSINSIGYTQTAKYINLINSEHQLSKLTKYLILVEKRSPRSILKPLTEREFVRKFLKQNDTTTKEIFNVFRNRNLYLNASQLHKIIGLIGNRDDMLKILKGRLNQTIQEKQKMVNSFEKSTARKKKRPRTRGQVVYLQRDVDGRVLERLKTDLSNIKRQKSNLQNLKTSTLRNKIKQLPIIWSELEY
tara:strand:+ start:94 stop:906 length:813 start_codon:yes stop_codon:yes gene_type:complete